MNFRVTGASWRPESPTIRAFGLLNNLLWLTSEKHQCPALLVLFRNDDTMTSLPPVGSLRMKGRLYVPLVFSFFVSLNKLLIKQPSCQRFETPSHSCDGNHRNSFSPITDQNDGLFLILNMRFPQNSEHIQNSQYAHTRNFPITHCFQGPITTLHDYCTSEKHLSFKVAFCFSSWCPVKINWRSMVVI